MNRSRLLCLLSAMLVGCVAQEDSFRELTEADNVANPDAHSHHHDHGPNGGHILELGDYHGEIAIGDDGVLTVYILGADATTPAPVADAQVSISAGREAAPVELTATPLEGEQAGASRYILAAESVPGGIRDIEEFHGSVTLIVGDKSVTAEVTHDHHDHGPDDHNHGDHADH